MDTKESGMKRVLKSERGMALAIAIVALVVVGALVAGALFSGTQEQRVAENVRRVQASFGVAEEGVYDIIRGWSDSASTYNQKYNALANYPSNNPASTYTVNRRTAASKTGSYSGTLSKFNGELYLIDITGQDTMSLAGRLRGGGASQRVGLLARIRSLQINAGAPLVSGGDNVVTGNVSIDGNDHAPWPDCAPLGTPKAGIRVGSSGNVQPSGSATITGSPNVLKDPTLADSTFSRFGDVTYTMLTSRANINIASGQNLSNTVYPRTLNGQCDKSSDRNWGDPKNPSEPCGGYFPIIHIYGNGNTSINQEQGQGILLVDGNLTVNGGFQWFGIVIIKGSLTTAGGGGEEAHFWGTVMAQDTVAFADTTNNLSGGANLLYSNCAILRALDATGVATMMRSRGWVQLF